MGTILSCCHVARDRASALLYGRLCAPWSRRHCGAFYSAEAQKLVEAGRCPSCSGQLSLAGKGIVRCRYCGVEILLERLGYDVGPWPQTKWPGPSGAIPEGQAFPCASAARLILP